MDWKTALSSVHEVLDFELFRIGGTPITPSTILVVLIILFVTFRVSRAIRKAVQKRLSRRGDEGAVSAVTTLLHYLVLVVGTSVAAQTAGIDLTALLAAGAIFAVGIGLAMQDVAKNFVSGIILLVERSIRPGDILEVEERIVRVERLGIRATHVLTRDGEDIILPNSMLSQSAVTNFTLGEKFVRIRFQVGVVYASDMDLVSKVIHDAAHSAHGVVTERPVEVLLVEFGDNAVVFEVAAWITEPWRMRVLKSNIAKSIWAAFQEHHIVIAFPQLDVHFDPPVTDGLRSRAA